MINKKSLLLAATALGSVVASDAYAIQSGPFIGGQIGFSRLSARSESTITNIFTAATASNATAAQLAASSVTQGNQNRSGFTADVVAGYLADVSGFLVGGELTVGLDTNKPKKQVTATIPAGTVNEQVKFTNQWKGSLNAVGGKRVGPIFAYAKLGIGMTKLRTSLGTPLFPKKNHTGVSLIPGIGVEYAVTDHIGVRGEGTWEFVASTKAKNLQNNSGGAGAAAILVTSDVKHKKYSVFALKAGAVFHV